MGEVTFLSSGSTGEPKRIVRTEATLAADAAAIVAQFAELWERKPVFVSSARPDHLLGHLWCRRVPSLAGCVVDQSIVLSVEELLALSRRYGCVIFVTTPSFLERAVAHPDFIGLRGLVTAVVTSGGLLREETSAAVHAALGVCPLEIFGSTEAGTVAWRRQCEGEVWHLFGGVAARPTAEGALEVDSPYAMVRPFVMSDGVEFVGEGQFLLKGRTDRRVKVLEEFVALPKVEAVLESHPLVARARVEAVGVDVVRLGALVVLTVAGRRALAGSSHGSMAARLRRELLPRLGERAFPRRIRFVHALPVDARGKTTVVDARAALSAWCREPAVLRWSATASRLEAALVFPPDCECFNGHFPGLPILPGVAQLYFLRHFAQQVFPDFPEVPTYRRLKFQKLILPGRDVSMTVERMSAGSFAFALSGADGPAASGTVEVTER